MLTWQPSQRTRGLLSGAHLCSASKIKKIRLAQGLGVDPVSYALIHGMLGVIFLVSMA